MGLFKSKEEKQMAKANEKDARKKEARKSLESIIINSISLKSEVRETKIWDNKQKLAVIQKQDKWIQETAKEEIPTMGDDEFQKIWLDQESYYKKLLQKAEKLYK